VVLVVDVLLDVVASLVTDMSAGCVDRARFFSALLISLPVVYLLVMKVRLLRTWSGPVFSVGLVVGVSC